MALNTARAGYTRPGTKHERTMRKSPSGHAVPIDHKAAPGWEQLVVPGPRPTGVKRPFVTDAGVQSHVLTESKDVPAPVPGAPRRRDRRPGLIAAAKAARKQRTA